jgi:hypothetical protein
LEVAMPGSRRDVSSGKAFAAPILGIVTLIGVYWLITVWDKLPHLLSATFTSMH